MKNFTNKKIINCPCDSLEGGAMVAGWTTRYRDGQENEITCE